METTCMYCGRVFGDLASVVLEGDVGWVCLDEAGRTQVTVPFPQPAGQEAIDHILGQLMLPDHQHVYSRDDVRAARAELSALRARTEALEKALRPMLLMCERANAGAFENGVRVEGSPDEGEVWASRIMDAARAALGGAA